MQAFNLPLQNHTRPVVIKNGYSVVLDSGAGVPVFYLPSDIVEKEFAGRKIGESLFRVLRAARQFRPFIAYRRLRLANTLGEYSLKDIPVLDTSSKII